MTFFIAYLRCISSLHIFIAYLHCISALHIFTAYLHCIYSLHLHCISSLLIFNAQLRRKVLKTITYFSKINRRVTILMKVLVVFYQKRKSLQKLSQHRAPTADVSFAVWLDVGHQGRTIKEPKRNQECRARLQRIAWTNETLEGVLTKQDPPTRTVQKVLESH